MKEVERFHAAESRDQACFAEARKRSDEVQLLKQEVREVLEYNILRFWIDRTKNLKNIGK